MSPVPSTSPPKKLSAQGQMSGLFGAKKMKATRLPASLPKVDILGPAASQRGQTGIASMLPPVSLVTLVSLWCSEVCASVNSG